MVRALLTLLLSSPDREMFEALDRADGILRSHLEIRTVAFVLDDDRELLAAIREAEGDSIEAAVRSRAHKLIQEMQHDCR